MPSIARLFPDRMDVLRPVTIAAPAVGVSREAFSHINADYQGDEVGEPKTGSNIRCRLQENSGQIILERIVATSVSSFVWCAAGTNVQEQDILQVTPKGLPCRSFVVNHAASVSGGRGQHHIKLSVKEIK